MCIRDRGGYLPMQEGESYLLFLTAYDRDSVYAGMYFPCLLYTSRCV